MAQYTATTQLVLLLCQQQEEDRDIVCGTVHCHNTAGPFAMPATRGRQGYSLWHSTLPQHSWSFCYASNKRKTGTYSVAQYTAMAQLVLLLCQQQEEDRDIVCGTVHCHSTAGPFAMPATRGRQGHSLWHSTLPWHSWSFCYASNKRKTGT